MSIVQITPFDIDDIEVKYDQKENVLVLRLSSLNPLDQIPGIDNSPISKGDKSLGIPVMSLFIRSCANNFLRELFLTHFWPS